MLSGPQRHAELALLRASTIRQLSPGGPLTSTGGGKSGRVGYVSPWSPLEQFP